MWKRFRFHAAHPDYRAVLWPPLGPYWCTGFAGDESYSTVVAYLPDDQAHRLKEFWPEASNIDDHGPYHRPTFNSRFPCPDYWDEDACRVKPEVAALYPSTSGSV